MTTERKRHRISTVEDVVSLVRGRGILDVSEIAEALDVSMASARRHADAGVARGELVRDEHDEDGRPLPATRWRYCEVA